MSTSPKFCGGCGAALQPAQVFCGVCGRRVVGAATTAAAGTRSAQLPATRATDTQSIPVASSAVAPPGDRPLPTPKVASAPSADHAGGTLDNAVNDVVDGGAATKAPFRLSTKLLALIAGVVVLLGASGYAVSAFRSAAGGGGADGANSPKAAVAKFQAALERKDPLALTASLEPSETAGLSALVNTVKAKATDGKVARKGAELEGIDLSLSEVQTQVVNLSKRVARVTITSGDADVRIDRAKLAPILSSLIPEDYTSGHYSAAEVQRHVRFTLSLNTVDNGRGWFVSPLYTIGSSWMTQTGRAFPTYSDQLPAVTTEKTPQAAAQGFLSAVASGGVPAGLSRLVPAEHAVLQDMSGLWQPIVSAVTDNGLWPRGSVSLASSTTTDLGSGQVGVVVQSASGTWAVPNGENGTFSVLGGQVSGTSSDGDFKVSPLRVLLFQRDYTGNEPERLVIDTVKVGDGYAVSLVGTATATASTTLKQLDLNEIWYAINQPQLAATQASLTPGQSVEVKPVDRMAAVRVTITEPGVYKVDPSWSENLVLARDGTKVALTHNSDSTAWNYGDSATLQPGTYVLAVTASGPVTFTVTALR